MAGAHGRIMQRLRRLFLRRRCVRRSLVAVWIAAWIALTSLPLVGSGTPWQPAPASAATTATASIERVAPTRATTTPAQLAIRRTTRPATTTDHYMEQQQPTTPMVLLPRESSLVVDDVRVPSLLDETQFVVACAKERHVEINPEQWASIVQEYYKDNIYLPIQSWNAWIQQAAPPAVVAAPRTTTNHPRRALRVCAVALAGAGAVQWMVKDAQLERAAATTPTSTNRTSTRRLLPRYMQNQEHRTIAPPSLARTEWGNANTTTTTVMMEDTAAAPQANGAPAHVLDEPLPPPTKETTPVASSSSSPSSSMLNQTLLAHAKQIVQDAKVNLEHLQQTSSSSSSSSSSTHTKESAEARYLDKTQRRNNNKQTNEPKSPFSKGTMAVARIRKEQLQSLQILEDFRQKEQQKQNQHQNQVLDHVEEILESNRLRQKHVLEETTRQQQQHEEETNDRTNT